MEQLDRQLQKRVWQRVQNREMTEMPQLPVDNIKPLILMARENLGAYQYLSGKLHRETLTRLQREMQSCIACMQAICRMRGESVKVPQMKVNQEPHRRMLEKCYHRERRLWTEWERRVSDPEHGVVFRHLADQAALRCAMIMEMIGRMEE